MLNSPEQNLAETLKNEHAQKQALFKQRLNDFKNLQEEKQFNELMFCLLTPQSNAKKCWQAVEEISKQSPETEEQIKEILKTKTRFHNTKAKRILKAKETWKEIKELLKQNLPTVELRDRVESIVNGYGLKESSHFLRNIGKSNNEIAILDRHILKYIAGDKKAKLKSKKHYKQVEQEFLNFANSLNIPADELDLLLWSRENGDVFK